MFLHAPLGALRTVLTVISHLSQVIFAPMSRSKLDFNTLSLLVLVFNQVN